jgi:hypothetical protein
LTIYELIAGVPAFDPRWALMKLMRTVDSDQRPAVPSMACPELVEVITACWDRDATKRLTIAQIVAKLSAAGWIVVKGADPKAVDAYLSRFPLDRSASLSEGLAALAERDRRVAALDLEVKSLKSR